VTAAGTAPVLWMMPTDGLHPARVAAWADSLDADERDRAARFVRESDRRTHIAAHVLRRALLSAQAPAVAPAAWRFSVPEPQGKPAVSAPADRPDLRVNLTHCAGLVAAVVARGREVGVDAEPADRPVAEEHLFRHVLRTDEVAALPADGPARARAFLRHWVRKEAVAKALGLGLALPLTSVRLGTQDPPTVHVDDPRVAAPDGWGLRGIEPAPSHLVAVVVEGDPPGLPDLEKVLMEADALTARLAGSADRAG
jgi:4'-phosphopantetheinyl transferase